MKISFIGGGNMAAALIGGLMKKGAAAVDIKVVEPLADNRAKLAADFGVVCYATLENALLDCTVLVLAVKPQQLREALVPLAGKLDVQLVLSIAAGTRMADMSRWLGGYTRLVRSMPNTPALIGEGITGWCKHPSLDATAAQPAEQVLSAVGQTLWLEDEAMIDAVTAISGSGPAYVFYFIEALIAAALELGFSAESARQLALATFRGATALAAGSDEDVTVLRQRVTSKGGTTEAALKSLDADQVQAAILRAVQAAEARGRELGDLLGKD